VSRTAFQTKVEITVKSYCSLFSAVLCLALLASNAFAQGTMFYEDLRDKFPDNKIMFETLEQTLDMSQSVFASIRISPMRGEKFAGLHLGPYYMCSKQKQGAHLPVRLIFTTKYIFIDKHGKKHDEHFDWDDKNTKEIKEKLVGVLIEDVNSKNYFPSDCQ